MLLNFYDGFMNCIITWLFICNNNIAAGFSKLGYTLTKKIQGELPKNVLMNFEIFLQESCLRQWELFSLKFLSTEIHELNNASLNLNPELALIQLLKTGPMSLILRVQLKI